MTKTIIGLEITEEGVRAAEVTTGRAPSLVAWGTVPLPPGAAKDSEVFDTDAVVLALRQLWSRAGFRSKRVVLGIGSRRIVVREYTTAAMRPDLLKQALPFQVQDLLPVPVNQAVLDFYPAAQEGNMISGLLVAAVSETVEQLIATVAKAKLTVDVVDLAPFGLARAVTRLAAPGETVAALHLGDHTSYVVIVEAGVPRFVRILPIDIVTDAVRNRELASLAAEPESAPVVEEVLETVPPSGEAPVRRGRSAGRSARPVGMSESALSDLVGRLRSTLSFYAGRSGDAPVSRVLLSGAGAAAPGVADALAATLPLPVAYAGAVEIIGGSSTPPVGDDSLNLLTTVGLALGDAR
ncbi:pilus assembly protein PilM [Microbacterium sp. SSM24]|uniref:pilus assembly protein PilM n=1 Tax=Microbacterium sp. SSM24 TaxID=2991714 RepID=UPI002226C583|nr:pilus assembly protein PilM [Microbacterium sp. SSM24]MCW3494790.1 pilus assembly protein PilM [Microbacterium sp. SSM24]